MDVVPLTADAPAELTEAWADLFRQAYAELVPELDPPSDQQALAELIGNEAEAEVTAFAAVEGDELAGAVVARLGLREDLDRAHTAVLVRPEHRRHGVGRLLLDAARPALLAQGRRVLRGDATAGTAGARFAAAVGARTVQQVVRSRLDASAIDPVELAAAVGRRPDGYAIVSWTGACPDELLPAYAEVRGAMNDAPHGDAERDTFSWDGARQRRWEKRIEQQARCAVVTVAVHEATGAVAGFTEILVPRTRPRGVEQEDTAVVAAHRGNGLGYLVKAVNLQRLLDAEPQLRWVVTWNAADNRYMRAVNTRLGFEPCAEELELELHLDG